MKQQYQALESGLRAQGLWPSEGQIEGRPVEVWRETLADTAQELNAERLVALVVVAALLRVGQIEEAAAE